MKLPLVTDEQNKGFLMSVTKGNMLNIKWFIMGFIRSTYSIIDEFL